jgi:hypothetical protein
MARVQSTRPYVAGAVLAAAIFGGAASGLLGVCGPFTDVAADSFCPFVFEVFTLGITTGTTPTTYDPASAVSRLQMAAFLSRTVDGVLKRGSRRAALRQFWTIQGSASLGLTTVVPGPRAVESDGLDIWVVNGAGVVNRVRGSDGKVLETWSGAGSVYGVLPAMGKIFLPSDENPGKLYRIDPSQTVGPVTAVATNLGVEPAGGIAFDGARIWTVNGGPPGSVSIVTPGATIPWTVTTVTAGFASPFAMLYDGANVWVIDDAAGTLLKLNATGGILQTVTLGISPSRPSFDGANIWVPNYSSNSVSVVRASSGVVLATLTGNGLSTPHATAFDGQRVLVTNLQSNSVSLWKAADLTPIGTFLTGADTNPYAACSDGVNFWIAFVGSNLLARF